MAIARHRVSRRMRTDRATASPTMIWTAIAGRIGRDRCPEAAAGTGRHRPQGAVVQTKAKIETRKGAQAPCGEDREGNLFMSDDITIYDRVWGERDKLVTRRTPYSATFLNELGNQIRLRIYDTPFKGRRRVNIVMEGPHSISRNIVTPDEADALATALSQFLGNRGE